MSADGDKRPNPPTVTGMLVAGLTNPEVLVEIEGIGGPAMTSEPSLRATGSSRDPGSRCRPSCATSSRRAGLMDKYEERPAYQRNDYLMWINKAERDTTKQKRLFQMLEELEGGGLYMNMKWNG